MEKLLNFIFIPQCIFCKQQGSFFCDKCLVSCAKCIRPKIITKSHKVSFYFIYEYERFIRECIRTAKYRNKHFAALKVLCEKSFKDSQVQQSIQDFIGEEKCIVSSIPVTQTKLKMRGFNQADLIAQKVSNQFSAPFIPDLLVRHKETKSQYTNSRKERFANLNGAFKVPKKHKKLGSKVILVDDVCTTGATFIEASRVLLTAGFSEVLCLSIARKSLAR